jgi:cytochrome b involved in lipid metabolism
MTSGESQAIARFPSARRATRESRKQFVDLFTYLLIEIYKMTGSVVTVEEIKKHSNEKDCWIVVNDVVWDITDFIPSHPGGNESEGNPTSMIEPY